MAMPGNKQTAPRTPPPTSLLDGTRRAIDRLRAPGLSLFVLAICLAPKTAPFTLLIAVIVASLADPANLSPKRLMANGDLAAACATAFLAWAAASAVWAIRPLSSLEQAAYEGAILLALLVVLADIQSVAPERHRRMAWALVCSVGVAAAFFVVELSIDFPITNLVFAHWPAFIVGNNAHIFTEYTAAPTIPARYYNHNVVALLLLSWPAVLWGWRAWHGNGRALATVALGLLVGAAVFLSQSETAKLALVAGLSALVLALLGWRTALWLTAGTWLVIVLLAVPLCFAMHRAGVQDAAWLQRSAQMRIEMWNRLAQRALDRPVLGAGMKALRYEEEARVDALTADGVDEASIPPQRKHAHNIYLQTWYELGAIGAMLLTALGLALLASLRQLARTPRVCALALFAAMASIGLTGHGLWQGWIHASLAWATVLLVVGGGRWNAR